MGRCGIELWAAALPAGHAGNEYLTLYAVQLVMLFVDFDWLNNGIASARHRQDQHRRARQEHPTIARLPRDVMTRNDSPYVRFEESSDADGPDHPASDLSGRAVGVRLVDGQTPALKYEALVVMSFPCQSLSCAGQSAADTSHASRDSDSRGNRDRVGLHVDCCSAGTGFFRTSTDVVVVPISVTDRNGRSVRGLTSDHFQISDGGTRRAVKQFSAERVPISLALLLDISGSMAQNLEARVADDARWADTRRAIELLLTRLGAEDEVLFAVFNEQARASQWTQEHRSILGTFDLLYPGGGTALLEAVKQIASVFHTARHQRKVLLLISDGNDAQIGGPGLPPPDAYDIGSVEQRIAGTNDWRRARRELVIEGSRNAVRRSDAVLYAVGIGTRRGVPVDTNLLDGLTKESGGDQSRCIVRRRSHLPSPAFVTICNRSTS